MRSLLPYLLVGLGGFAGANARFIVARASAALLGVAFPYGTFIINISGSFLLGVLVTLITQRLVPYGDNLRLAIAVVSSAHTPPSPPSNTSPTFNSTAAPGCWHR